MVFFILNITIVNIKLYKFKRKKDKKKSFSSIGAILFPLKIKKI